MSAQNTARYSEVPNRDDSEPPSYFNVVGQIKQAQESSKGKGELLAKIILILVSSVLFTGLLLLLSALPIAQLVIGILYQNRCKIDPKIPLWLIVMGASGLAAVVLKAFGNVVEFIIKRKNRDARPPAILNLLNCFLSIFLLIWFILGNIWVYSVHNTVDTTDSRLSSYCNHLCYWFAFWSITATWIVLGLCFICIFCTTFFSLFKK